MPDGFTSYEGNAVLWAVYHNSGCIHVWATSEAIALHRAMAKYPNISVREVKRAQNALNRVLCIYLIEPYWY